MQVCIFRPGPLCVVVRGTCCPWYYLPPWYLIDYKTLVCVLGGCVWPGGPLACVRGHDPRRTNGPGVQVLPWPEPVAVLLSTPTRQHLINIGCIVFGLCFGLCFWPGLEKAAVYRERFTDEKTNN